LDFFSNVIYEGTVLSAYPKKVQMICNEMVHLLFTCGLVNDAVNISDYAVSGDLITANNEFKGYGKQISWPGLW
jgi:hypothetical protein